MWMFAGFPGEGTSNDSELSTTAIFSISAGYLLETLEMRSVLLYSDTQSVVGFSVIPKCMTLNDLEFLFHVKFCFHAGLADSDRTTFEN